MDNPSTSIAHISFYKAGAHARWKGARLPTESGCEVAPDFTHAIVMNANTSGAQPQRAYDRVQGVNLAMQLIMLGITVTWFSATEYIPALIGLTCVIISVVVPRFFFQSLGQPFELWLNSLLVSHLLFGMGLGFYESSMVYDKVAHGLAFIGLTLLTGNALERHHVWWNESVGGIRDVGLIMIALSVGAAWEMFEYLIDWTQLVHAQHGLHDTMLDLFADLGGALAGLGLLHILEKNRHKRNTSLGSHQGLPVARVWPDHAGSGHS